MDRFMDEHDLSFQITHPDKRTNPNDPIVAEFYTTIQVRFQVSGRRKVFNMDETCWRVVDGVRRTAAKKNSKSVKVKFGVSPKSSVTVIATISAAGEKLPLWVVESGTTEKCLLKFRGDRTVDAAIGKSLILTYSENGWTTRDVAIKYLRWLRVKVAGPLTLVWDVFAAHRDAKVVEEAKTLDIFLVFVPAGQTDEHQPLDVGCFAPLKARARKAFDETFEVEQPPDADNKWYLRWSIKTLLGCWQAADEEEIRHAWDHMD
jgi:hypothetical protein